MLPSVTGHGYCLRCAKPIGEIPLVDARATPKAFMRIRTKWGRALLKHDEDAYQHYFGADPYVTFPPKARGGAPPKFTPKDDKRLLALRAAHPDWTYKQLAEDFEELWRGEGRAGQKAKLSPKTVQRRLQELGRPKKKPARRS